MLDIRELDYWISRYEHEANSLNDCVTLSALYSVRDKLSGEEPIPQPQMMEYSMEAEPVRERVDRYGDSDFLRVVEGKDLEKVFSIIDENMETIRVTNSKMYESVMRRLERI